MTIAIFFFFSRFTRYNVEKSIDIKWYTNTWHVQFIRSVKDFKNSKDFTERENSVIIIAYVYIHIKVEWKVMKVFSFKNIFGAVDARGRNRHIGRLTFLLTGNSVKLGQLERVSGLSVVRYIGIRNYWATHTTWILFKIQAKLAHCKSNPLFFFFK